MTRRKTLIFVPTYNERDNVGKLCEEIQAHGLDADLAFTDDSSPDGTGAVLDELAARRPRIRVFHRAAKLGIGSAHQEAVAWAYENGYQDLVTMDADFAHSPKYLPDFIAASRDFDVVVGSRYRRPDSLREWNLWRKTLTRVGHLLTRHLLGLRYDATGAYRLYRLDRVPRELFGKVRSRGYSFFFESLYAIDRAGLTIGEVPIDLPARTYGSSKMAWSDILQSVWRLFQVWTRGMLQ